MEALHIGYTRPPKREPERVSGVADLLSVVQGTVAGLDVSMNDGAQLLMTTREPLSKPQEQIPNSNPKLETLHPN